MVLDELPSSSWVHNYTTWVSHGCLCSPVGSPWCLTGSGNITGSTTYANTAHHEAPGSSAREWDTELCLCVGTGVGAHESMCRCVHASVWFHGVTVVFVLVVNSLLVQRLRHWSNPDWPLSPRRNSERMQIKYEMWSEQPTVMARAGDTWFYARALIPPSYSSPLTS